MMVQQNYNAGHVNNVSTSGCAHEYREVAASLTANPYAYVYCIHCGRLLALTAGGAVDLGAPRPREESTK